MARRTPPHDPSPPDDRDRGRPPTAVDDPAIDAPAGPPDLSAIPVAGFTRRRVAWIVGLAAIAWVVLAIGRQVGDVAAVNDRAADLRAGNTALEQRVDRLEDELTLISRQAYVAQQARAHRLGEANEIPFTLAAGAPPLPADAPGSAATAVGAPTEPPPPLERWLELLLGPSD